MIRAIYFSWFVWAVVGQAPTLAPDNTSSAPTLSPLVVDRCFMMGETMNSSDVVIRQGMQVVGDLPIVSSDSTESNWLVWLLLTCVEDTQTFNVLSATSAPAGLTTTWSVDGTAGKQLNSSHEHGALTLKYACSPAETARDYTVNVTVDVVKTVSQMRFSPVTFAVTKRCPASPAAPGGGFGTFVLVVFILTLIGCTGGCCFKYVRQGERGLAVVPGLISCSRCLGRCAREPRYSPQMDVDGLYGGDHGTVGDSYQGEL